MVLNLSMARGRKRKHQVWHKDGEIGFWRTNCGMKTCGQNKVGSQELSGWSTEGGPGCTVVPGPPLKAQGCDEEEEDSDMIVRKRLSVLSLDKQKGLPQRDPLFF